MKRTLRESVTRINTKNIDPFIPGVGPFPAAIPHQPVEIIRADQNGPYHMLYGDALFVAVGTAAIPVIDLPRFVNEDQGEPPLAAAGAEEVFGEQLVVRIVVGGEFPQVGAVVTPEVFGGAAAATPVRLPVAQSAVVIPHDKLPSSRDAAAAPDPEARSAPRIIASGT